LPGTAVVGMGAGLADDLDDVVDDLLALELVHGSRERQVPDFVVVQVLRTCFF